MPGHLTYSRRHTGARGRRRVGPGALAVWALRALAVGLGLGLALSACTPAPPSGWAGYVEGDYVYIAAPVAGTLRSLAVQAGDPVARGAALFTLDADAEAAARAEAQARLQAALAQAADGRSGRRADELAVSRAQLDQARAAAERSGTDLARQQDLAAQGYVAPARVDEARSAHQQALAQVAERTAALQVARLPARRDEQVAGQALAEAARQALAQARWREQQKAQAAPVDARVADTFQRVGEWVPAGAPVVALLPPGAVLARFFVPEAELASVATGQAVTLHCDGCPQPLAARITRIATQAEYTPPVIYSNAQRARLVFRVEARPDAPAPGLHPGLPIEVRRVAAAPGPASGAAR